MGVCGEAAADPLLASVLAGLGVTSLSAAAAAVPAVGSTLSQVTLEVCRRAAAPDDPEGARAAAQAALG